MTVYHAEHDVTLHQGHVADVLPTLTAESVNCVVTSPPYYGLRDYGVEGQKNMLGLPWRVAFALQDDGWTLRNDVIWSKPNAMPESVTDRLATRHEHVFLFSKSRRYWFDLDAIREPQQSIGERHEGRSGYRDGHPSKGGIATRALHPLGSNPGDVWTIPTSPYPAAHFATFPPELARRCIAAGCPPDGTVLDPFAGSGTTLMVARRLMRKSVGIELNAEYCALAVDRIGQPVFDFGEVPA